MRRRDCSRSAAEPGDGAPNRPKRTRRFSRGAVAVACAAVLSSLLVSVSGGANEIKPGNPAGATPGAGQAYPSAGGPSQNSDKLNQSRLTKEEVESVLPLFLTSSEARQLAAALEFHIRRGDFARAKQMLESFGQASTFAVLASDWLHDPMLLGMLHAQGIRGTEAALQSGAATPQVGDLENALKQERDRVQAMAQEHAIVAEELARLKAAREDGVVAAAQVSELQNSVRQERERAQAMAQEHAAVAEKLANLQAAHERSAAAAVRVGELENALKQERERAQAMAQDHAAVSEKLASLQAAHERSATVAAQVGELQNTLEQERKRARALAQEHAAAKEQLASLQAARAEGTAAAAQVGELQNTLKQERERAKATAQEHAALKEQLAGLQAARTQGTAAATRVSELEAALRQERERAQAAARESAAAKEQLASLQAARVQGTAAAAQVSELQNALRQERERAQATSRENAAVKEKLASLQAAHQRSAAAAARVGELENALKQERERAQAIARENAASLVGPSSPPRPTPRTKKPERKVVNVTPKEAPSDDAEGPRGTGADRAKPVERPSRGAVEPSRTPSGQEPIVNGSSRRDGRPVPLPRTAANSDEASERNAQPATSTANGRGSGRVRPTRPTPEPADQLSIPAVLLPRW
jgi:hypothetical protein